MGLNFCDIICLLGLFMFTAVITPVWLCLLALHKIGNLLVLNFCSWHNLTKTRVHILGEPQILSYPHPLHVGDTEFFFLFQVSIDLPATLRQLQCEILDSKQPWRQIWMEWSKMKRMCTWKVKQWLHNNIRPFLIWWLIFWWRHHFWPKLASSILNFCRRKRSFQWCPDQSDRPNGALDMHKNVQKVEWKTRSKISCHYTWMVHAKNYPSQWRFVRSLSTASKPSRSSITAAKTREKEKKERRKKKFQKSKSLKT